MRSLRFLIAAALFAAGSAQAVGNLADITIQDRSTGRELPVYWHEGHAYVVGRPGNEYQVNVRNRRGEDLLAVVSVDGVNVVSGENANVLQSGYVISSWQRMDIRGWRKSLGEIASFYFTSLGDSYAARTGRPDNVGVIGVAVFRRKPAEPPPVIGSMPYPQEPNRDYSRREKSADANGAAAKEESRAQPSTTMPAQAAAPLGTGHGRREESRATWVAFDRASDTPAETVTIYYDSYRNLVARGVLTTPVLPRHPEAFPGFVPDPA
jgi:hypothetical protein